MGDHGVLFLQIPHGTRPSYIGPLFQNDIVKIGIAPILCGHRHKGHVPVGITNLRE